MTKVLIEIEDGKVFNILSNKHIEYVVVNLDNPHLGKKAVDGISTPDAVMEYFYLDYTDADPVSQEIHDELKRLKF